MVEEVVIAYHEAGHAVLAEQLGGHVLSVTIIPMDDDGPRRHGETRVAWRVDGGQDDQVRLAQVQVALAGPVAEMIYTDTQYEIEILKEWWADWLVATRTIRAVRPKLTELQLLSLLEKHLQQLIGWMSRDDVWHQVATVADELEAHESLDEEQLDDLRSIGILGPLS